jgi:hypothetical protein
LRKYKKGDRVEYKNLAFDNSNVADEIGTIIVDNYNSDYGHDCLVEFDNDIGGHSGDNDEGKYGHCWYVDSTYLILTKPKSIIYTKLTEAANG